MKGYETSVLGFIDLADGRCVHDVRCALQPCAGEATATTNTDLD